MTETGAHLQTVVLCGTSDAELWPISRSDDPIDLTIPSEGSPSLLAATIRRYENLSPAPLLLVVQEGQEELYRSHIAQHDILDEDRYEVLTVPGNRGSAFSIALAAVHVKLRDPECVMLITPSNQTIDADDRFQIALDRAYEVASLDQRIALVATAPSDEMTPHAFVKVGLELKGHPGVFRVRGFVDRPSPVQAARLSDMGALWVTGISLVKATAALSLLEDVDRHDGSPLDGASRIAQTASFLTALGCSHWTSEAALDVVESLPDVSFASCIVQDVERIVAVPAAIACASVDSLESYYADVVPDHLGNRISGNVLTEKTRRSIIDAPARTVVALGVEDLVIVDTPDALLVARKDALGALPEVAKRLDGLDSTHNA